MTNVRVFTFAIVVITTIICIAISYEQDQSRKHIIEMAKLGYTQVYQPGFPIPVWVKE